MTIEEQIEQTVSTAIAPALKLLVTLPSLLEVQLDNNALLRSIAKALDTPPAAPAPTPPALSPPAATPIPVPPAPIPEPPAPSAVPSSGTSPDGTIGDSLYFEGSKWTVEGPGRSIRRDGKPATDPDLTLNVVTLAVFAAALFQMNSSNQWYKWTGNADWTAVADPRPVINLDMRGQA